MGKLESRAVGHPANSHIGSLLFPSLKLTGTITIYMFNSKS